MNRLLINMKNKIDSLNDAIDLVNKFERGETIKLGGLINSEFGASKDAKLEDFESAREKLISERINLENRVYRMSGEHYCCVF